MMPQTEKDLLGENARLRDELEEYKDLVEAIRTGGVDALAISKDGRADIFSLESADFVYRVLVENFAEGAINVSDKGIIIYANPAFENLLGCTSSIVGTEITKLIDPFFKRTFEQLFRDAFSGTSKGEISITYRDRRVPVKIALSSLYPRYQGIGILITDLSERKLQEAEISNYKSKLSHKEAQLLQSEILQRSVEKFRFMSNTIPQKVWTADSAGNKDYFNERWEEYSGLSQDELVSAGWSGIIHNEDRAATELLWSESVNTGQKYEMEHRLRCSDGSFRWHFTQAVAQQEENAKEMIWLGTSTDIHEQKAFTQELEDRVGEAVVFLQTIFDSSEELIASFDTGFNFTSINKVAANYIHIEASDFVGKNLLEVFPNLSPVYMETLNKVLAGEIIYKREVVEIAGKEMIFDTYYKPLLISNEVRGIVIVATDVTAIVNITDSLSAAKAQLEDQFLHIEKKNAELQVVNAELLSFTYVASHDLKEPLRKIRLFSNMIVDKRQNELSDETRGYFTRITSAVRHMQNLIDALLSYSKISNSDREYEATDLHELLAAVQTDMQELLDDKGARIIADHLPVLRVVPFQVSQLFTNLISNSLKYSREEEKLVIHIRCAITAGKNIVSEEEIGAARGEEYLHISFEDNGIGFDQAYQFKIFELFQRLHSKEDYDGTGVGLAICNKIVQNHNGFIDAHGVPGKGSTFNIYIPLSLTGEPVPA